MGSVRLPKDKDDLHFENERQSILVHEEQNGRDDDSCSDSDDDKPSPSTLHRWSSDSSASVKRFVHPSWSEFRAILKEFPNSQQVWSDLEAGKWDNIFSSRNDVNTALLLSATLGQLECMERLLNRRDVDVNSVGTSGRSALHLACSFGHAAVVKTLIERGAMVNMWDSSKKLTPLHCAASNGSVDCIRALLASGAVVDAGIEFRSALHMAVERNAIDCVELLLEHGANPNCTSIPELPYHIVPADNVDRAAHIKSRERDMPAIHLAARKGYLDCLKLLLREGADVNILDVRYGCSALHSAIVRRLTNLDCIKCLLDHGANIDHVDNYNRTPLRVAVYGRSKACAELLIDRKADLTAQLPGGRALFSSIVRGLPEVIPKIVNEFDSAITVYDHKIGDFECELQLDLKKLIPNAKRNETALLSGIIESGQKQLLKHPLCEAFIFHKWRRVRKFFLLSLLFRVVYVTLLTTLILGIYGKNCPRPSPVVNGTVEIVAAEEVQATTCETPNYVVPIGYIMILMNVMWMAKECFQIWHGAFTYVRDWENWIQCTVIGGVFFCITPATLRSIDLRNVPEWQYHVAAFVAFVVWMELMIVVGRFPFFGVYMVMFRKIAINFAKFLFAYSCLLAAFGLSFSVLFNSHLAYDTVPQILIKMIAMMSGELDFEDTFYGDVRVQFPGTAHAIFLTFIIMVTIILTNLLIGLSVNDIQELRASAELDRLSRQVELIARLEEILWSKKLTNLPPAVLSMMQRSALLHTAPEGLVRFVKINSPTWPRSLRKSIFKFAEERHSRRLEDAEPNITEVDTKVKSIAGQLDEMSKNMNNMKLHAITTQLAEMMKQIEAMRGTQEKLAKTMYTFCRKEDFQRSKSVGNSK